MGGIASYTVNLARALKAKGENVYVASSGGELTERLKENGIPYIDLGIKTKSELNPKLIKAILYLRKYVRKNNIDIIHAQTRVAQMVSFFVSKLTDIPYVSTCHGFFESELPKRLFGLWGEKVIAINDIVKEYSINTLKIKKAKIEAILNGIDIVYFSKGFSNEELSQIKESLGLKNFKIVGTISRLVPIKGIEYFIEAANLIIKERMDVGFIIVGNGPHKEELEKRVKAHKMEDKVKFIEAAVDTRPYLNAMEVFVLSSIQEGLGLSIAEAMASGKPIVATEVGGVSALIKNEETGLLVPGRSPAALKSAIIRLLDDRTLSDALSKNAKEFARINLHMADMADKTLAVYKKVVFNPKFTSETKKLDKLDKSCEI
jgi:glycosyltransferase involved in cell wall biosynthesis